MDAVESFRYAMDSGAIARFVADGRRLAPEVKDYPAAVKDTVHRMRAWWEEQAEGVDLDAIDAERYEDPQAALSAIEAALGVVSGPKTYAKALGIWGSAQAGVYRLDYATMGIGLAIEAAQAACDRELVAVLLQRAAYTLRNRGELDWALEVSDAMLELRAGQGNLDAMGRGFVVHGVVLHSAGAYQGCARSCRAALGLLSTESQEHTFWAYQTLSLAYESLGRLDEAGKMADHAGSLCRRETPAAARLAWAHGRIAERRESYGEAAVCYGRALSGLGREVVDAALVGAALVRALLKDGQLSAARHAASKLSPLVDAIGAHPMDFDRVISAAVLDLVWAGLQAKLTERVVERAIGAIEQGRAAAAARLRTTLRL